MGIKMRNIFIIGKPGSGKGTLATHLVDKYNYVHISMGDLLREETSKKSELGLKISRQIDEGNFADLSDCTNLLRLKLGTIPKDSKVLLDGYPRKMDQLEDFVSTYKSLFDEDVSNITCINLLATDESCKNRILGRSDNRKDDREDLLDIRFHNYNELTLPLSDVLKSNPSEYNIKYVELNGELDIEGVKNEFDNICGPKIGN